jgi:hypothetical protein
VPRADPGLAERAAPTAAASEAAAEAAREAAVEVDPPVAAPVAAPVAGTEEAEMAAGVEEDRPEEAVTEEGLDEAAEDALAPDRLSAAGAAAGGTLVDTSGTNASSSGLLGLLARTPPRAVGGTSEENELRSFLRRD